jgi:hypothetical protein
MSYDDLKLSAKIDKTNLALEKIATQLTKLVHILEPKPEPVKNFIPVSDSFEWHCGDVVQFVDEDKQVCGILINPNLGNERVEVWYDSAHESNFNIQRVILFKKQCKNLSRPSKEEISFDSATTTTVVNDKEGVYNVHKLIFNGKQ